MKAEPSLPAITMVRQSESSCKGKENALEILVAEVFGINELPGVELYLEVVGVDVQLL